MADLDRAKAVSMKQIDCAICGCTLDCAQHIQASLDSDAVKVVVVCPRCHAETGIDMPRKAAPRAMQPLPNLRHRRVGFTNRGPRRAHV